MQPAAKTRTEKVICLNKKAFHEFEILTKYDTGIVLQGTEVKALRMHRATITESFARLKNGEVWLVNSNIPHYAHGNINNHEPTRTRKLLLGKKEIRKITDKLKDKSLTLVPLKLYFSGPFVKAEIAVAKGKKLHDKRESIKSADIKRQLSRVKI